MNVEHAAHEIFLLMLNLSQMHDEARIKSIFIESMNSISEQIQLRFSEDGDFAPAKAIEIATTKRKFGSIVIESGADALENDLLALIGNAVSMLALILEKHRAEQLLDNEKIMLQETIAERTRELELTNQGLEQEIAERKRAEKALRNEQALTETALNSQHETFFLFDPATGEAVRWNRAFNDITGYTDQEISQMKAPNAYYSPTDLKRASVFIDKVLDTGIGTIELDLICKDGRKVPTEYNVSVVKAHENVPTYFLSIGRDITERREAEAALEHSEERFRSLYEKAPLSYQSLDGNGNFLEVNETWLRVLGYERHEVVGKNFADFLHPEWRDHFRENFPRFKAVGEIIGVEFEMVKKDGSLIMVSFHGKIGRDAEGSFKQTHCIFRDITEERKILSEKKSLEAQLRQAQKMEAIGTLAGGIAHDFNNILSSIIGFSELALDDVEKDSEIEDNLHEVYTAGLRAKELVKQILAFARQSDEALKPLRVDAVAKEVLKLIRSSIPSTIEIKQQIESDSRILGNATQVHQILMNLCTNAAHAMEEKGGILKVGIKDIFFDSTSKMSKFDLISGDYIELTVSDTGTGIAPHIIESIFEPYFTTKAHGEGSGMGLAVVHGIVESYGGQITVESQLLKGTVFTIYLPIAKKPKVPRQYEPEKLPTGMEHILFVDDEVPITKIGCQLLDRLGYSVTACSSSLQALELFRSNSDDYDLIISDITMPNLTGDKLAVELMKIRPDIPVILCTGYSKKMPDKKAKKIGIKAIAYKPIVRSELAKTVRKVLDDAKGQTPNRKSRALLDL